VRRWTRRSSAPRARLKKCAMFTAELAEHAENSYRFLLCGLGG
jgi:hypothetical protein